MTRSFIISVFLLGGLSGVIATSALATRAPTLQAAVVPATNRDRIFEIRTYTVSPGQLPALNQRFRDNTVRIFARHGMESIGYWTPLDSATSQTTLIYVLAHPSREAATRAWKEFGTDPEWIRVRTATEAAGLRVLRVESVFATATDYSPIR